MGDTDTIDSDCSLSANEQGSSSEIPSSSTDEGNTNLNEHERGIIFTPPKKRYKSSIRDSFNKRRALYHKAPNPPDQMNCTQETEIKKNNNRDGVPVYHRHSYTANYPASDVMYIPGVSVTRESSGSDTVSDTASSSCVSLSDTLSESDIESLIHEPSEEEFFSLLGDTDDSIEKTPHENKDNSSNTYLYEGSKHTYFTSYTTVMLFVQKHSLSKEAFSDLLNLVSTHLPSDTKYHTSIYKMKEFLKKEIVLNKNLEHQFCEHCTEILPLNNNQCSSEICKSVNAEVLRFHDLDIEKQLQDMFQDDQFCQLLEKKATPKETDVITLKDITDGMQYKHLLTTLKKYSLKKEVILTFTMNTDGVAIFSSSNKGSLWPIYLSINELPVRQRFAKNYIITSYLYCETAKPNMLSYMKPLGDTLERLCTKGVEVTTKHEKFIVRAFLLAATLDLPARAMVANMKQFNGKWGCNVCLDEGETAPGKPLHRYWPFNPDNALRTHHGWLGDATKAVQTNEAVHGIKGASPLVKLPYIDLPKVFVIDWMHCVLLGVTKALLKHWLHNKNKTEDFYIGDKLSLLNRRLMSIKVPDFVARRPRALDEYSHWKANELREWLFHFSVPVLEGILETSRFVHYQALVTALYMLNKDSITLDDISLAKDLLIEFCRLYPEMYGRTRQSMNVHQLQHLPHFVTLYGPLFTTSCFGFESMNSHLKSMVHGTRFVNNQIAFAVAMTKSLPKLVKNFEQAGVHEDVVSLAQNLSSKLTRDPIEVKTAVLGKKCVLTNREQQLIRQVLKKHNVHLQQKCKFLRWRNKNEVFTSEIYECNKTRNSYCVMLNNGRAAIVKFFVEAGGLHFALIEEFKEIERAFSIWDHDRYKNLKQFQNKSLCSHIKLVTTGEEKLISTSCIVKKCVLIKFGSVKYVSIPPNLLEHN